MWAQFGHCYWLPALRFPFPVHRETMDGWVSLQPWASPRAPSVAGCESGTLPWGRGCPEGRTGPDGSWRRGHWDPNRGKDNDPPAGYRAWPPGSTHPPASQSRSQSSWESLGWRRLDSHAYLTWSHCPPPAHDNPPDYPASGVSLEKERTSSIIISNGK